MIFNLSKLNQFLPSSKHVNNSIVINSLNTIGYEIEDYNKNTNNIDVSILANRPDVNCYFGLARELSWKLDIKYRDPSVSFKPTILNKKLDFKNNIKNSSISLIHVEGGFDFKVPKDIIDVLKDNNININLPPIILIANYVTLLTGQPLHIYDNGVLNSKISFEQNKTKKSLEALDGKKYKLNETDLISISNNKIISLLGIIGAKHSSVNNDVKSIIVESANFPRETISNTSKRISLFSDSSLRFRKIVTTYYQEYALKFFVDVLRVLSSSVKHSKINTITNLDILSNKINLNIKTVSDYIGREIPNYEIKKILKKQNYNVIEDNKTILIIETPKYRSDVKEEVDLIEDIVRFIDPETIRKSSPRIKLNVVKNSDFSTLKKIENKLISLGFQNVKTYKLMNKENVLENNPFEYKELINVKNFQSSNFETLKVSNAFSIFEIFKYNFQNANVTSSLFEIVSIKNKKKNEKLLSFINGNSSSKINLETMKMNLLTIVSKFLNVNNIKIEKFLKDCPSILEKEFSKKIMYKDIMIGYYGPVNHHKLHNDKISIVPYLCEINISKLNQFILDSSNVRSYSVKNPITKKVTFVISQNKNIDNFIKMILRKSKAIYNVSVYKVEKFEKNIELQLLLFFDVDELKKNNETIEKIISKIQT